METFKGDVSVSQTRVLSAYSALPTTPAALLLSLIACLWPVRESGVCVVFISLPLIVCARAFLIQAQLAHCEPEGTSGLLALIPKCV